MPKLIRLYIINVAIGFALSLVFVTALVWMDIAHLRHLVLETSMGWVAFLMMFVVNGVVFAGAQFAIAVMRMADPEDTPPGGKRDYLVPAPVRVSAPAKPGSQRNMSRR